MSHSYPFPTPLLGGTLLSRYKRFFADILLDSGETITAHCPNTGPMTGVCQIGSPVLVSHSSDPKRSLAYTWELIRVESTWVGVNTSQPNRVIQKGLEQDWFPELAGFARLQREVAYGSQKSKIDILLTDPQGGLTYVEIKNTTWCRGSCALFPDTVTTRGQKHLEELIEVAQQGHRAVILYFIHRGDCDQFSPGDDKDPDYGRLLRQAVHAGVEVLPCRFAASPQGLDYLGLANLKL